MRDSETLAREVIARCQALARFSEDATSIRRTFLSPPMRDVSPLNRRMGYSSRRHIASRCRGQPADPLSWRGSRMPRVYSSARTLIPSPMPERMTAFSESSSPSRCLPHVRAASYPFAIEVVGFSEEEGVRFGTPFIGSRALVGTLNEELLSRRDAQGISIREAIANFGLNPADIPQAAIGDDILGYIRVSHRARASAGARRPFAGSRRSDRWPKLVWSSPSWVMPIMPERPP